MRREFIKRFWKYVTGIVPAYGLFPLGFSFVFNCLVYSGSRAIAGGWYHHNIESNLDLRLPFVPQFLIIYFGCYVFCRINGIQPAGQQIPDSVSFDHRSCIGSGICQKYDQTHTTGYNIRSKKTVNLFPLLPCRKDIIHCPEWKCQNIKPHKYRQLRNFPVKCHRKIKVIPASCKRTASPVNQTIHCHDGHKRYNRPQGDISV